MKNIIIKDCLRLSYAELISLSEKHEITNNEIKEKASELMQSDEMYTTENDESLLFVLACWYIACNALPFEN